MTYTVAFQNWNSVFAVPAALVDEHIKLAGAAQLKVILWVLRQGGQPFTAESVSKALHLRKEDTEEAIQYWVEAGFFSSDGSEPETQASDKKGISPFVPEPEEPAKKEPSASLPVQRKPRPTGIYLSERITQSEEIAFLMQEAQRILGRTISPALSGTLVAAHDDYGLPIEVIVMLLMYAKEIGKCHTHYIDAAARGWSEEGIFTHDLAEQKIRQLSELTRTWHKIETALGMTHRAPSSKEEQYVRRWTMEWRFSVEMIREAYDRCADATGKLSFGYMNKILERWQKNNIRTVEAAREEAKKRSAKKASQAAGERTYDIDAFDAMDFTNEIRQNGKE